MDSSVVISILLILLTSALLVVTGLKKQPGLGVIGALIVIILATWLRGRNLASLGLSTPGNWLTTILLGLALGALLQLISVAIVEPLSERLTHTPHDLSLLANVKGNWKAFLQWMLMVWILVALLEECVYRGFLMHETAWLLGTSALPTIINVLSSSAVFGLSHGYQGRSGILSTGVIGILLAIIFVWNGYNLWLLIFTHGFIDTVGIGLIALDWDKRFRHLIWRETAV